MTKTYVLAGKWVRVRLAVSVDIDDSDVTSRNDLTRKVKDMTQNVVVKRFDNRVNANIYDKVWIEW